jgi:hypothetical protein
MSASTVDGCDPLRRDRARPLTLRPSGSGVVRGQIPNATDFSHAFNLPMTSTFHLRYSS